ncbi:hypothetical protein [Dyadobacter sp. CY326]|uniref:hypothetical protein n=1 Tax=Dyadobacter sp. CY326 TaxID=2907300 RepID=UPI001F1BEA25|nr:hypothetical protein [Dyadobacter sp. CY326]MCE7065926.1 hypothetical protein [Dyadobacter sp. CY326]
MLLPGTVDDDEGVVALPGTVDDGTVVLCGTVVGCVVLFGMLVAGTFPLGTEPDEGCVVLPGIVVVDVGFVVVDPGCVVLSGTVPGGTVDGLVDVPGTVVVDCDDVLVPGCVVLPGCVDPGNVDGCTVLPGTVFGCVVVLPGVVVDEGEVVEPLVDEPPVDGVLLEGKLVCANTAVEHNMANAKIFSFIVFMIIDF